MLIEPINSPFFSSGTSARVRPPAKFHGGHTQRIAFDVGLTLGDIVDLDKPFCLQQHSESGVRAGTDGCTEQHFTVSSRCAVDRGHAKKVTLSKPQVAELSLTDANSLLQHGVKHGLQITRRTADDLEDFRCRGLLLQRLGEVRGASRKTSG